jgi:hypothetical protein
MNMELFELPPERELTEKQLARLRRDLGAAVTAPTASAAPGRQRLLVRLVRGRPRRALILALVCSVGLTGAALAVVKLNRSQPGTDIACLSDPTLNARVWSMVGNIGQDPVAACAQEWTKGVMVENGRPLRKGIPALVACLTRHEGHPLVVVLPSPNSGICAQLGLERAPVTGEGASSR